jgi:Ribbon-helix-helix domain
LEALGRRGDLSQFVEEAVNARLQDLGADKKPRITAVEEGAASSFVNSEDAAPTRST